MGTSEPMWTYPAGDSMEWPDDFQFGITIFSIGLWRSRGHFSLSVMVNKHDKKFIVLVDKSRAAFRNKKTVRLYNKIARSSPFRGSFPFSSQKQTGCILAYEIEWEHIVGIDYRNPLCEDGRLVMEVRQIVKREFSSLNDAHMFYMATPPPSPSSPTRVVNNSGAHLQPNFASRLAEVADQMRPVSGQGSRLRTGGAVLEAQSAGHECMAERSSQANFFSPLRERCRSQDCWHNSSSKAWPREHGSDERIAIARSSSAPDLLDIHQVRQGYDSPTSNSIHSREPARPWGDTDGEPWTVRQRMIAPRHALESEGFPEKASGKASSFHPEGFTSGMQAKDKTKQLPALSIPSPASASPAPEVLPLRHMHSAACVPSGSGNHVTLMERQQSLRVIRRWGKWDVDETGRFRLYAMEDTPWRHTGSWPHPARWTLVSESYHHRTVVINFSNPVLPLALESVFGSDKRLLRLYESGLPSWAVFMPTYGIWYRPWMRNVTFCLFIAISLFSLACGFYDLYKNVPFLNALLKNVVGNMYIPFVQWLEEHTKVRLSILLTYLFGKSPLFMAAVRLLTRLGTCLRMLVAPFATLLMRPFVTLWRLLDSIGDAVWAPIAGMGASVLALLRAPVSWVGGTLGSFLSVCRQLFAALLGVAGAVGKVLEPLATGVASLITEPLVLLSQVLRFSVTLLHTLLSVLQRLAVVVGGVVKPWLPLLRGTASVAAEATRSAAPVAHTAAAAARSGGYWRKLILKVAYALRSVVNVISYFCCTLDRHRKSLVLALLQRWEVWKVKVGNRIAPWLAVLLVSLEYLGLLRQSLAAEVAEAAGGGPKEAHYPLTAAASRSADQPRAGKHRSESTQGKVNESASLEAVFGSEMEAEWTTHRRGGPVGSGTAVVAGSGGRPQHDTAGALLATRKLIRKVVSPPSNRAARNRMHRTTSAPKLYTGGDSPGDADTALAGVERKKVL